MINISLTSSLVGALSGGLLLLAVALDDKVKHPERAGRVAACLLWSLVIAVVVPEEWGVVRPLVLSGASLIVVLTGFVVGYIGRFRQWQRVAPVIRERVDKWQKQEEEPESTAVSPTHISANSGSQTQSKKQSPTSCESKRFVPHEHESVT